MLATLAVAAMFAVVAAADSVNFDNLKPGAPPPGWTATRTGSGDAKWTIEEDSTAPSKPNVLKQSGQATYPVCIKDDTNLKDGFVEVKFKPISGREDQAGGVIWRAKDSNNYYVARANALENNVTIYHTINARRTEKKRSNMKIASNQWHNLRVDARSWSNTPCSALRRRKKHAQRMQLGHSFECRLSYIGGKRRNSTARASVTRQSGDRRNQRWLRQSAGLTSDGCPHPLCNWLHTVRRPSRHARPSE